MEVISVLLADDHGIVRDAIAQYLGAEPGIRVVATAPDGNEAVRQAKTQKPEVAVLDVEMPGLSGLLAAEAILECLPRTKVVLLSAWITDQSIEHALSLGGVGYMTKSAKPAEIVAAIRAVMAGKVVFAPEIQERIVLDSKGAFLKGRGESRCATLTDRELEVLRCLAQAKAQKEIARSLNLSIKTVHRHIANLMAKLRIHDRVELMRFAVRERLTKV